MKCNSPVSSTVVLQPPFHTVKLQAQRYTNDADGSNIFVPVVFKKFQRTKTKESTKHVLPVFDLVLLLLDHVL